MLLVVPEAELVPVLLVAESKGALAEASGLLADFGAGGVDGSAGVFVPVVEAGAEGAGTVLAEEGADADAEGVAAWDSTGAGELADAEEPAAALEGAEAAELT